MPPTAKIEQLVQELAILDDPQERLALIVDRSRRIAPLPPAERIDAHRVRGCVSIVWLVGEIRDGCCHFRGDAESPVVRGLLLLLCECFSGFPPAVIVSTPAKPLEELGLLRNLSPTRRNGLAAAHAAIRQFAQQHLPPPP